MKTPRKRPLTPEERDARRRIVEPLYAALDEPVATPPRRTRRPSIQRLRLGLLLAIAASAAVIWLVRWLATD